MSDPEKIRRKLAIAARVLEIDAAELAVRMCEANYGLRRPSGMTGQQALDAMDEEIRDGWLRSAAVAVEYFHDLINKAGGTVQ